MRGRKVEIVIVILCLSVAVFFQFLIYLKMESATSAAVLNSLGDSDTFGNLIKIGKPTNISKKLHEILRRYLSLETHLDMSMAFMTPR